MQLRDLHREAVEYARKQRGITEDQFAVMLEERILSDPTAPERIKEGIRQLRKRQGTETIKDSLDSTLYAVERFSDLVDKELNGASKYSEGDDQ